MVPSWRGKINLLGNSQWLISKTQHLCLCSLNLFFSLTAKLIVWLVQVQWVSDSGKRCITFGMPNDFGLWSCFKLMKPTLFICTFIFSHLALIVIKRHRMCKYLHKGTLLLGRRRCAVARTRLFAGGPQVPAERVLYQLTGKRVSSIMQGFFPLLDIVLEIFNLGSLRGSVG